MKKYQEAIASYEKAITIEPSKEKAITGEFLGYCVVKLKMRWNFLSLLVGYIREVHLAQQTAEEEALAKQLFDSGDVEAKGLVEILQRIHKEDQLPVYYSGGLRSLTQFLMNNGEHPGTLWSYGVLRLHRPEYMMNTKVESAQIMMNVLCFQLVIRLFFAQTVG